VDFLLSLLPYHLGEPFLSFGRKFYWGLESATAYVCVPIYERTKTVQRVNGLYHTMPDLCPLLPIGLQYSNLIRQCFEQAYASDIECFKLIDP